MLPSETPANFETILAENQRLRRLVEILHDSFCPVDREEFPQREQQVSQVFFLDPDQQEEYWYAEARRALGLTRASADVPFQYTPDARMNQMFRMRAEDDRVQH